MVSPSCGGPVNGRNPVPAHTVPLLMEARCSKLVNTCRAGAVMGEAGRLCPEPMGPAFLEEVTAKGH